MDYERTWKIKSYEQITLVFRLLSNIIFAFFCSDFDIKISFRFLLALSTISEVLGDIEPRLLAIITSL